MTNKDALAIWGNIALLLATLLLLIGKGLASLARAVARRLCTALHTARL